MRKEIFRMERQSAVALLERAPFVHLASTTAEGEPVLRVLHAVVVEDKLLFHAAPVGEKMEAVGRRAVIQAEEIVASIPSYFVDPERACPATTLYRSAQVHGTIERVDDPKMKARMLAALMDKHQPEGGFVPIDAEHPLYKKPITGVLVLAVSLAELDGKAKLGQNRTPVEVTRMMELLWKRGARGDVEAVDLLRRTNPAAKEPTFLMAPSGTKLVCAMGEADVEEATALLVDTYWNEGISPGSIRASQLGSQAWVGARDEAGSLIGSARAISDGAERAWIYDVVVSPRFQRHGVGRSMLRLLLDHPAVRHVHMIGLSTRDAERFYEPFGFCTRAVRMRGELRVADMMLERPAA